LGLDPLPENSHPKFLEALNEIQRAAQAHNLPLGIYCSNGKAAAERIRQGFLMVNVATDVGVLQRGVLRELEDS
jgi:4-hydroxy-2-oxoheptanedioate aldolase